MDEYNKPMINKYLVCKAVIDSQVKIQRQANNNAHIKDEYKAGLIEGAMLMYDALMDFLDTVDNPPINNNGK